MLKFFLNTVNGVTYIQHMVTLSNGTRCSVTVGTVIDSETFELGMIAEGVVHWDKLRNLTQTEIEQVKELLGWPKTA